MRSRDQSDCRIVIGLLIVTVLYSSLFGVVWTLFLRSKLGFVLALGFTWAFSTYHTALIDDVLSLRR